MLAQPWRRQRRLLILLGSLLVTLLAWGGFTLSGSGAYAATDGVMLDYGGWTVGTRQLDSGEFVFCIEPGAITPSGPQHGAADVEVLRGYSFFTYDDTGWSGVTSSEPISGEPLRRINYVLSTYGNTSDAQEAVAVQFAIWILRDAAGEAAWLSHHINWVEVHGGARAIERAAQLVVEARALPTKESGETGVEPLHMSSVGEHGVGEVGFPAGTSELRIEGGVFADGMNVYHPGADAGSVAWFADLHKATWAATAEVSITGSWERQNTIWPARLRIYASFDPDQQTLSWAVGPTTAISTGEFEAVRWTTNNVFTPTFSTQTVEFALTDAGVFSDVVTLEVASGSAPWPQRTDSQKVTEWMPIKLTAVLYGPYADEQDRQNAVPADAPVRSRVELIADAGPGKYEITAPETPQQSGYYYWVWTVSQQDQVSDAQAALFPNGYRFSDDFGLPEESHLVTMPVVPTVVPPASTSTSMNLASTGSESLEVVGLTVGMLSLTAGALLLLRAARRKSHDLQQSCSFNL